MNDNIRSMAFSLLGRALYVQENPSDYKDDMLMEIFEQLKDQYKSILRNIDKTTQIGCIARAMTIDVMLEEFTSAHPSSIIINLGAGLDTHYYRIAASRFIRVSIALLSTLCHCPAGVNYE